ncbi:archaellum component FlaG (FlaF/FlaG flagellin family) [Marmoricola sp. OAE513]|uniref:hypothetical protein n=1 Tax=Marmoricola sp. OAE513 TaxID=2817894 RepID=UPI001AE262EB
MKTSPTRGAAALASLVAAVLIAGCGGPDGSSAPKDASVKDFCKVVNDLDTSDAKGFAEDLAEVGTPKDIPAEARDGFEIMVDNAAEKSISDSKQKKVSTFVAYFTTTCSGA